MKHTRDDSRQEEDLSTKQKALRKILISDFFSKVKFSYKVYVKCVIVDFQ